MNRILNPNSIKFSVSKSEYKKNLAELAPESTLFLKGEESSKNKSEPKKYTFAKTAKSTITQGFVRFKSWVSQTFFGEKSITHQNLEKAVKYAHSKNSEAFSKLKTTDLTELSNDISNIKLDQKLNKILNNDNNSDIKQKLNELEIKTFAYIATKKAEEANSTVFNIIVDMKKNNKDFNSCIEAFKSTKDQEKNDLNHDEIIKDFFNNLNYMNKYTSL